MQSLIKSVERHLEERLRHEVRVEHIREIPGGFLSNAYVAEVVRNGKNESYFLRNTKERKGGYSYPIDRLKAFHISHEMYENAEGEVESHGYFEIPAKELPGAHPDSQDIEFFHIQTFRRGRSYYADFLAIGEMETLTESTKALLEKIARKIGALHSKPVSAEGDHKDLYKRGFQEMIAHPEITLDVLACFPDDHPFFGICDAKYAYMDMLFRLNDHYRVRAKERKLSYLHGDFWSSNILVDESEEPFFIDYSRIPYGDAGIDIGWFVGTFVMESIMTGKASYREAAKHFVRAYAEATGDEKVLDFSLMSLFWVGIISAYPPVFGSKDPTLLGEMRKYLEECYRAKTILL